MKKLSSKFFFNFLAVCGIIISSHNCVAQAVPDTSHNHIIAVGPAIHVTHTTQRGEQPMTEDADTAVAETKPKRFQPNPKKAGLYSALVPGLGQLYNRQYWKVPVVYVGLAVAAYFLIENDNKYESYYTAYIGRINNPYPTDKYVGEYNIAQLQQLQEDYSKYLDMTGLFSVIGYALQVMDAVTSAHLKNFDISRDISMKIRPVATPNGVGLGLVMNMK